MQEIRYAMVDGEKVPVLISDEDSSGVQAEQEQLPQI